MSDQELLAERFEANRAHLRSVAYRMLGSLSEADDAVQEAWLRFSRADSSGVANLSGWLTTVTARVCLDMLRSRAARREESLPVGAAEPVAGRVGGSDPEAEALLADAVGLALLVVLDTLPPAERLAFVLHDVFAVPFEEIAPIVERSQEATRKLASRARRRVRGAPVAAPADLARQRAVVEAFLAAARQGDFEALLALLDPEVVLRDDRARSVGGEVAERRGVGEVARQALKGGARAARTVLVNGAVGVVVAPRGHLLLVLGFTLSGERISAIEVFTTPARLRQLDLALLHD